MGTSRGMGGKARKDKRPGAAGCKLCELFATACFSPELQRAAAPFGIAGCQNRSRAFAPGGQAMGSRLGVLHEQTRARGTLPHPVHAAAVGVGGWLCPCLSRGICGSRLAPPYCLTQDPGALSRALSLRGPALGIPGWPGVQPEPRAAHAAADWSCLPPWASSHYIRILSQAPSGEITSTKVFGANL